MNWRIVDEEENIYCAEHNGDYVFAVPVKEDDKVVVFSEAISPESSEYNFRKLGGRIFIKTKLSDKAKCYLEFQHRVHDVYKMDTIVDANVARQMASFVSLLQNASVQFVRMM